VFNKGQRLNLLFCDIFIIMYVIETVKYMHKILTILFIMTYVIIELNTYRKWTTLFLFLCKQNLLLLIIVSNK
jgi:hypothetical protein